MKTHNDSLLISRYQDGCEDSLKQLIEFHKEDLYSFIYYKLPDADLANDVFQDTFMKIIVMLKERRYNDEGKFILWAKRISHNLIIDHFRLKAKHPKISESTFTNEEFSIFDIIRDAEESIEEKIISMQINKDLLAMMNLLPENQREVLELRYFKGLSFKEIADETGASINTTLGRARYALINLRKIMEENNIVLTR